MKWLRLVLCLAVFVPAWAVVGFWSTAHTGNEPAIGLTVGAALGLLIGLVVGGARGAWLDFFFGPMEQEPTRGDDQA